MAPRAARRARIRAGGAAARARRANPAVPAARVAARAPALAVCALECLRRHVLGGRAVAQRRNVRVHTREGALIQLRKALRARRAGQRDRLQERLVHALTTSQPRIHHEFQSPTLKWTAGWPDESREVPRIAAPTVLLACAASLIAAPSAAASLDLPPGAGAPPQLPPGVVVAESPTLTTDAGQGALLATSARSRSRRSENDTDDRPFWATVNICDTAATPNGLGVRTSVPGNGTSERIFARYTA